MISVLIVLLNLAFAAAPADGSYLRSCYTVNEDDALQSVMQIQQDKWTQTHTAFEEASCKTPYLIYQTEYKAAVSGGELDLSVVEASYTILSREVAEALNMVNYCGFNNWKPNAKRVVTGLLCDEFQVPAQSDVLYSIFKIQPNADQDAALYLGASAQNEDGKTPSARHQGFESTPYLKLQP